MLIRVGPVDSQKKVPPGVATLTSATDTGSNRNFDDGACNLTWTAPTFDGKSPLVGYDLVATPSDGGATITTQVGLTTTGNVTGLRSGIEYTYTVKARNQSSTGPNSAGRGPIRATTKPNIPTNVSASNLNTGSTASVSWSAPANGGSTVTQYTVKIVGTSTTLTTSGTSLTFTGLTNGNSYSFVVTATNANGTSAESNPSNVVGITQPAPAPAPVAPPSGGGCTSCFQDTGTSYCSGANLVINQTDPCCGRTTTPRVVTVNGCASPTPTAPPVTCCQDDDAGFCNNGTWFQNQFDPCGSTYCSPRNTGSPCTTSGPYDANTTYCIYTNSFVPTSGYPGNCQPAPTPTAAPTPTTAPTPTAAPGPDAFGCPPGTGFAGVGRGCIPTGPVPTTAPTPTAAPVVVTPTPPVGPFAPWPEYFYTGVGGPPAAPRPQYPYYCLSIDSMIPTPNGDKRLSELKIGDQVISARFEEIDPDDPNADLIVDTWSSDSFTYRELDITTIVNIREWEETGRYTINNRIHVTGSHPFVAKEAADGRYYYTRAAQLVEGDLLFDGDLETWVPITSITYAPNIRFKVRTLSTEPYDMFFAEGILVHNK